MKQYVTEPERQIPVAARADVVVIGGGFAGIAAAAAAARSGASVILVEKQCVLGGLGTAGLIVIYLPLCDGYGRQLIGGLGEELLKICAEAGRRSVREGQTADAEYDIPKAWQTASATRQEKAQHRYRVTYEAAPAMLALERFLLAESVDLWYDTLFCGCNVENGRIRHVFVENKSGRLAIEAGAVVDCSGDADVCFAAGEATVSDGSNVRSGWYYGIDPRLDKITLHKCTDPRDGTLLPGARFYRGDSGKDISQHMIDMHRYIADKSAAFNRQTQGSEIPFLIPTMPLLRMTRRLSSAQDISVADMGRWDERAVGMSGDWRRPALGYCIPYASLHGASIHNLLAAGRCFGVTGDAWDALRVIPTCAVTGEAAGAAAAEVALGNAPTVQTVDAERLAATLKARGVILDASLLDPVPV